METKLTELFPERLYPAVPPKPPTRAMIDALDRPSYNPNEGRHSGAAAPLDRPSYNPNEGRHSGAAAPLDRLSYRPSEGRHSAYTASPEIDWPSLPPRPAVSRVPARPALPPSPELPAPSEVKPAKLPLRFEFRKEYYSIYTTQGDKFILREEHLAQLRRLMTDFNRFNPNRTTPLTMSDIINACLDFAFEHALNLRTLNSTEEVRDAIAKEVYRKAFFQFLRHYEMV